MIVRDIMQLFLDPDNQHIQIALDGGEKIVYDGDYGDIPEDMNCAEVSSINNIYEDEDVICINVCNVDSYER